jgi:hypothetical protein
MKREHIKPSACRPSLVPDSRLWSHTQLIGASSSWCLISMLDMYHSFEEHIDGHKSQVKLADILTTDDDLNFCHFQAPRRPSSMRSFLQSFLSSFLSNSDSCTHVKHSVIAKN